MVAAIKGHTAIVRYLIAHGAVVDDVDEVKIVTFPFLQ